MNLATIITIIILAVLFTAAVVYSVKHKGSCGGDCGSCGCNCCRKNMKKPIDKSGKM